MNTLMNNKSERGFSMIEVLISVVVLGFGLLALAALQTTIIRASSETKAQTVALQLAKDKIEELRSYETLAGYNALNSSTSNETINDVSGDLSGVNFERGWVVSRFAYNSAGTSTAVTPNVGTITTAGTYLSDNEYKRVVVTVEWDDANGNTQSIGLEDGLGAISPDGSSKVTLNNTASGQARKPKVYIYDPGLTGGVIPIAIGNGSSTAASNPTPVLKSKTTTVAETLFEVLTYGASNGNTLAQSRVETAVVHCTCETTTSYASTDRGYRPTFWNGYRYAPPSLTIDKPIAKWADISNRKTTESDRCTSCCRDHRDPSTETGAKFDPWRTTHNHYKVDATTGVIGAAVTSGTFDEACRLIRVDGFFRVASDFRSDHMGLLETNNSGTLTDTVENNRPYAPKTAAKTNYQNFILKYLDGRFSANTAYNYNYPGYSVAASSLESAYSLNNPADINLTIEADAASNDAKWLHSRGLYVDFIEPEALDVIKKFQTNCSDKSTQDKRNACVLPFVPFTSINVTELADWLAKSAIPASTDPVTTANDSTNIQVENNGFVSSLSSSIPVRGDVYAGSKPVIDAIGYAYTYMGSSNAGLADFRELIDPEEVYLNDTQKFNIKFTGTRETINFKIQSAIDFAKIGSASGSNTCGAYINTGKTADRGYPCQSIKENSSGTYDLKISGYTLDSEPSVANPCGSGNVIWPTIIDYDVLNITLGSNTFTPSSVINNRVPGSTSVSDTTFINVGNLAGGEVLTLNFKSPTTLRSGYTCDTSNNPIWTYIY